MGRESGGLKEIGWSWAVGLGFDYETTFGNATLGFNNATAPALSGAVRRVFSDRSLGRLYAEYLPVLNSSSLFSANNLEFIVGASYFLKPDALIKHYRVGLGFEFSSLNITVPDLSLSSQKYSLRLILGF